MKKFDEKIDGLDEKTLEEEVKSTRSLINTFLLTVKAYRLYEADHPIQARFLDRMKKDFDSYFNESDSFSILVKEHQLLNRGQVVYESQDVRESLAFAFYKDGIREIRFYKGLDLKEMTDFLDVVRKGDRINRSEDDLVTLLWEKDFSHIDFTTVDDFLEGSGTLIPVTEEDLKKQLDDQWVSEEGRTERNDPKDVDPPSIAVEGLRQALSLTPGQSLVHACQLSTEEMEEINQVAQQEQQPEYVYVLIDNLIEILLHLGEDMDAYENMISFFQRAIESLLDQGDVKQALQILNHLNGTLESIVLKDKQIFAIQRILEASSSPRAIECLGKRMKENGEVDSEALQQYLQLVGKQAVDPLCLLLEGGESGKWRRMICDRLAEFAQEDIQPLTKYLSHSDPFVVCHILYVLGKSGNPSVLKYLGPLVIHHETKVREETLHLVTRFEEKGKDLLQKFLKDAHPEIRGKASHALARVAGDQAVKPLAEIILSEDFYKRPYDEKASFFKALGETKSKEAVPILQRIARKRGWFQRARWQEMRQCATMALKMMGVS